MIDKPVDGVEPMGIEQQNLLVSVDRVPHSSLRAARADCRCVQVSSNCDTCNSPSSTSPLTTRSLLVSQSGASSSAGRAPRRRRRKKKGGACSCFGPLFADYRWSRLTAEVGLARIGAAFAW